MPAASTPPRLDGAALADGTPLGLAWHRAGPGARVHEAAPGEPPQWRGHESLSDKEFVLRHGAWRGLGEENSLFFYLDEYIKDSPKDLLAVMSATADWLGLNSSSASRRWCRRTSMCCRAAAANAAERAVLLYGTLPATSAT